MQQILVWLEKLNCKVAYDEEKNAVDQIFKKINASKGKYSL